MMSSEPGRKKKTTAKLTVVIPCYNEEKTLKGCIERVRDIADSNLALEIIIVDDCSEDNSYPIAQKLQREYKEVTVLKHEMNQGKGAALSTGFKKATGDFVAVQDADLEYDPMDLKRLLVPLIKGEADVVLGSRFLSSGAHRVLYFWHSLGNRFLTLLSNVFTDLNLTDMETCYKVFRREVIQSIDIKEKRFGFEPEIVAKIAHLRLRIFEMGISYSGRTYEEGKKIGARDAIRAIYCIFRYNAHNAPMPIQLFIYLFIGAVAAVVNFYLFRSLYYGGMPIEISAPVAFIAAAIVNYLLCIAILFQHRVKWKSGMELVIYFIVVGIGCAADFGITKGLVQIDTSPEASKIIATMIVFVLNFLGRRYIVFPESPSGAWKPQTSNPEESKPS
jgi:glycosyltransferase involved in cell wall biosynthesis